MLKASIAVTCFLGALTVAAEPSPAAQTRVSQQSLPLPLTRGETIVVRKVVETATGHCRIESSIPDVNSYADLHRLVQRERAERRRRYGRLSLSLCRRFDTLTGSETTPVRIVLRMPRVAHPSRFSHTPDQLARHSRSLLAQRPAVDPAAWAGAHGLHHCSVSAPNVVFTTLTKAMLREIAFDDAVAVVEPVSPVFPCGDVLLFSELAQGALNPAAHPADREGAGVLSGIVEGLSSDHAKQTTACLTNMAPRAAVVRHSSAYYDSLQTDAWLLDNQVETVSMSLSRDPSQLTVDCHEFMLMDDFIYRWPCPVFCTPAGNGTAHDEVNWQPYGAVCVGSAKHWRQQAYLFDGFTCARNPEPRYGACLDDTDTACAGDRELPEILAPGSHPFDAPDGDAVHLWGSDPQPIYCDSDEVPGSTYVCGSYYPDVWTGQGTSYATPIVNGTAARLISSNVPLFGHKPDAVKMALLLTAHNVVGGYWDPGVDQRDGAGVVSAYDAVAYGASCTDLTGQDTPPAVEHGYCTMQVDSAMTDRRFRVLVPQSPPHGRHLRAAMVWTSTPDFDSMQNVLSDLDLGGFMSDSAAYGSHSLDASVEMFDVPTEELTPGREYELTVYARDIRIPPGARTDYFYCTLGWTWVRDHADTTSTDVVPPAAAAPMPRAATIRLVTLAASSTMGALVTLPAPAEHATIAIFNAAGRRVAVANARAVPAGPSIVPLDTRTPPAPGLYVCIVRTRNPGYVATNAFVVGGQ